MPLSKDEIKNSYPLPSYNYVVEVNGTSIAFSQASGLNIGFETTTYKQSPTESGIPGPVVMRMPAQPSEISITLQKGIVKGKSVPELYKWLNATQVNQTEKKDIDIRLMDEAGTAIITWSVKNAFPTGLDAPTFDANSNDAAVETLKLMADRITIEEN